LIAGPVDIDKDKMRKSKFIRAIAYVIAILGGFIMLESMISGIFHFTGKLYKDFKLYTIELQASRTPQRTTYFSAKAGQRFTVWLRYATKQVGNKHIDITVSLIDEDENMIKEFEGDLRFGDFRFSRKRVRYHKLGQYCFHKAFRGYMLYELGGTWIPTETSAIVMQKSPPLRFPLRQIGFFVIGVVALIFSIDTIVKHSKKRF
jgi:hypothetical protein